MYTNSGLGFNNNKMTNYDFNEERREKSGNWCLDWVKLIVVVLIMVIIIVLIFKIQIIKVVLLWPYYIVKKYIELVITKATMLALTKTVDGSMLPQSIIMAAKVLITVMRLSQYAISITLLLVYHYIILRSYIQIKSKILQYLTRDISAI